MSGDRHDRFHELLAARLDEPLAAADDAALGGHLAACPACRAVERDYAAERLQLRALAMVAPPRDLWARTRTAIDHEIARQGGRPRAAARLPLGRAVGERGMRLAVGSLVGVLVVLMMASGSLVQEAPIAVQPTPFSIAPQSVAFVDFTGGTATLYRTDVSQACPAAHVDCRSGPDSRPVAQFVAGFAAQEMALGNNGQVFIASRDGQGGEIYSIVDLAPATGPQPTPSATPEATPPAGPTGSADPGATTDPHATPGSPSGGPSTSPSTPPGTLPTAEARPILSGVRGTGAPAAWSPDGSTLAFSAIPADHSRGSDIYIWRPGDDQAQPLTSDHRSLFASWAGGRIVVSRLVVTSAPGPAGSAEPGATGTSQPVQGVETVVIDPLTAEERAVDLPDGWLPSVDPTRHWVVYWTGRLASQDGAVVPQSGELVAADWASIDPWAADDAAASPEPTHGAGASASAGPTSTPKHGPSSKPGPTATEGPLGSDAPTTEPQATATGSPSATEGADADSDEPAAMASPALPGRPDGVSGETVDWVVRWSVDGSAFGVWTAAGPAAGTGWLTVRSEPSADSPAGLTLVGPSPARRSFALGADRVVWVTPLANGDGELWMATWGAGGKGSLRIRSLDSPAAVPAF